QNRVTKQLRVFLVTLEQFYRDALWAAQKADAHARADGGRLLRELDALCLDLGRDRVDVFHGEAEMIEPLIRRDRRYVDSVAGRDRADEDIGAAEFDVDAARTAHDLATEDIAQPGRGCLGVGAAQMNMVPGHNRHRGLPRFQPIVDRCDANLAAALR